MVETLAGIWLFLLTAAAGFLAGRYVGREKKPAKKPEKGAFESEIGWQQLLNFLQYDGSGLPQTQNRERVNDGGETQYHGTAGTDRVYPRGRV